MYLLPSTFKSWRLLPLCSPDGGWFTSADTLSFALLFLFSSPRCRPGLLPPGVSGVASDSTESVALAVCMADSETERGPACDFSLLLSKAGGGLAVAAGFPLVKVLIFCLGLLFDKAVWTVVARFGSSSACLHACSVFSPHVSSESSWMDFFFLFLPFSFSLCSFYPLQVIHINA